MGRYATDVDVAYFDDIDTSVKADRDFQQFDGTRGGFHSFLTTSLIPHLQGRGEAAASPPGETTFSKFISEKRRQNSAMLAMARGPVLEMRTQQRLSPLSSQT